MDTPGRPATLSPISSVGGEWTCHIDSQFVIRNVAGQMKCHPIRPFGKDSVISAPDRWQDPRDAVLTTNLRNKMMIGQRCCGSDLVRVRPLQPER